MKREKPVGNQGLGEADATAEIDRRAAIKWASRYQRSGPCTATASMSSASAVQANRVRGTAGLVHLMSSMSSVAVGPRADDFLAASADAAIMTGYLLGHENSLSPPTPTVGVQAMINKS